MKISFDNRNGIFASRTVWVSVVEQYDLVASASFLKIDEGFHVVRLNIKFSKSMIGCKLWRWSPRPWRNLILTTQWDLSTVCVFKREFDGSIWIGPGLLCHSTTAPPPPKYKIQKCHAMRRDMELVPIRSPLQIRYFEFWTI